MPPKSNEGLSQKNTTERFTNFNLESYYIETNKGEVEQNRQEISLEQKQAPKELFHDNFVGEQSSNKIANHENFSTGSKILKEMSKEEAIYAHIESIAERDPAEAAEEAARIRRNTLKKYFGIEELK